jgi:DNA-binding MurR/RpiR family transcriptional regulator
MSAKAADPRPARLEDLFAGVRLTPVQRRIAVHIVEQGARVAFSSSVELAEQVGVSQPSVTRLAAAVGYPGFGELQRAIQDIVLERGARAADDGDLNKMQRAVQHSIDNLAALQDQLADTEPVERAAQLLSRCATLLVYGSRSSTALARQFDYFAARIRPQVRLARGSHSELCDQFEDAQQNGPTALLAIVLPRYPREAVHVLQSARELGLDVVLVTDSLLSPLAALGTVVLPAQVNADLVFDATVAPAQILVVLLEALADADPARSRSRLDRFENLAATEGYFVDT